MSYIVDTLPDELLFFAETIADELADNEFNKNQIDLLCQLRKQQVCVHSPVGEHKCYVGINFMPQSGIQPFYVDTCLQREIQNLMYRNAVRVVECCCGHGVRQGYIKVTPSSEKKMLELKYVKLQDGEHCFKPKTQFAEWRNNK